MNSYGEIVTTEKEFTAADLNKPKVSSKWKNVH